MKMLRLKLVATAIATAAHAQPLSTNWEELTAEDFVKALDQAKGVCILPFGIIEKHGPMQNKAMRSSASVKVGVERISDMNFAT